MPREKIAALVIFSAFVSTFLCALPVRADVEVFEREYTYQATKIDTKESSRAIALEQVKNQLLDELGIYVESTSVVENDQIQKNEIKVLTAGIVKTDILDEKWDGSKYWIKVKLEADPNDVAKSIAELRKNQEMVKELEQTKKDKESALQEIDNLKAQLASSQEDITAQKQQYNTAVNNLVAADVKGNGDTAMIYGDYDAAAASYTQVVEMQPTNAVAFYNLGIVYIYLGNYTQAVQYFDRSIVLNPRFKRAHSQRQLALQIMHNPHEREKLLHRPLQRQAVVNKNQPAYIVGEGKNLYIGNSLDEINAQKMKAGNEPAAAEPEEKLMDNPKHENVMEQRNARNAQNVNWEALRQQRRIEQQRRIADRQIRNLNKKKEGQKSAKGRAAKRGKPAVCAPVPGK
ncbi:MAG TPA: tetratricopeptide repeat protein [Smithella sp.]|nr:tetratricopeptide repeat protein [Smithella sp.]